MLTRIWVAVAVLFVAGCAYQSPEQNVFDKVRLKSEIEVVAKETGRTGFNLWGIRYPKGYDLQRGIVWPKGYAAGPAPSEFHFETDCGASVQPTDVACRSVDVLELYQRPLGKPNFGCVISLHELRQKPVRVNGKRFELAQIVIDC